MVRLSPPAAFATPAARMPANDSATSHEANAERKLDGMMSSLTRRGAKRVPAGSRCERFGRPAQPGLFQQRQHAIDEKRQLVVEVDEGEADSGEAQPVHGDQRLRTRSGRPMTACV